MKIKFFKKENNFKKKDFNLNPNFYWKIAVIFVFISIVFSCIFGYQLFDQIEGESNASAVNISGQIPMIKEDRIKSVLFYFTDKEQKSADVLKSPAAVVDPSL
ncbi:MAG: hypothetical protein WC793_03385 [Candidatus Paceibacterota bacterium]|jgi:hypothetical protein